MNLNIDAINHLINDKFRNNKSYFADEIGINKAYLNCILNKKRKLDSPKTCNAIINYCKKHRMDYKKYIFLP